MDIENSTHRRPPRFRKDAAATNLAQGHYNLRNDPQNSAELRLKIINRVTPSTCLIFTNPFTSVPYLQRDVIMWLVHRNLSSPKPWKWLLRVSDQSYGSSIPELYNKNPFFEGLMTTYKHFGQDYL